MGDGYVNTFSTSSRIRYLLRLRWDFSNENDPKIVNLHDSDAVSYERIHQRWGGYLRGIDGQFKFLGWRMFRLTLCSRRGRRGE